MTSSIFEEVIPQSKYYGSECWHWDPYHEFNQGKYTKYLHQKPYPKGASSKHTSYSGAE